jgi:membrane protein DedA with SNARE-associated domain
LGNELLYFGNNVFLWYNLFERGSLHPEFLLEGKNKVRFLMDILPEAFNIWLMDYGSVALFLLLALGIIALPVPEETLLLFTGVLVSKGMLSALPVVIAAYFGSITGITCSYLIGSTGGLYVIHKYGCYFGVSDAKMQRVHNWFEKYGKWLLFVGYFIPGVRHFTGLCAGISALEYRQFAFYAYTGAIFWASLFLSLGYFFGNFHQEAYELLESNLEIAIFLTTALVISILLFAWSKYKKACRYSNG